jgi:hypothetical protein
VAPYNSFRFSEFEKGIHRVCDSVTSAIDRAKKLGTYKKIDRTPQYSGPECATPEALLEAVNVQGNHIRASQANQDRMQRQVFNLKLRNSIIVAVITALVSRAPDIWAFLYRWFQ